MSDEPDRRAGGCLCGKVRFEITLSEPDYNICHCDMCRRWGAGPFMAVHGRGDDVTWLEDEGLAWFRSSKWAERGFCSNCGASLFYRMADHPQMMLVASIDSLDDASGIALGRHIYCDVQPERYAFADDTPRVTEAQLMEELGITQSQ